MVLGLRLSDFRPTGVELANRVRPFSVAVERSDCSGGLSDSDIDNTTPPACLPVAPRAQGIASFRLGVLAVLIVLAPWSSLEAAPIEVRFAEGAAHGLLLVRSVSGETVGHGDLLQTAHGDRVESRLILRFKDGSLHDEHVVFSQQGVFTLLSYRLMQRGPSFPDTVEVSLDRKTGSYKARSARDGKEQESSGSFELPPDVYNGMAAKLLKNLARGASETVQVVAFTPKPRLIGLEMTPAGAQRVVAGDLAGRRPASRCNPSWARPSASSPPSWGWRRPTKSASS